jgi:murein DD-endopeptidase MepM/ murein hydrolase activator NlpD
MAIKDKLDQNFTDAVLKKTLIGNSKNRGLSANDNNDMIPQNDIVAISNSFTSLQNAFNKIYAYSLNVRNLHQFQEKRLQTINRETNLEAKTGGGSSIQSSGTPQNNLGSTTVLFDDLSKSIEGLNDKLKNVNLGGSGFSGTAGGMAGGLAGEELGALAGGAVGGPVGAGLGGFFGGIFGFFTGSKIGNNVQRRAAGGSIKSGSTYLVGERGPEVISFNGVSGRVTPNGQRGKPSMAEKYLLAAAERSSQSRTKFEKGNPIGPTSYSSKFSNYLSTLFGIIPTWVKNIFNPNMGTPSGALGTGQYTPIGDLSNIKGNWKDDTDFIKSVDSFAQKWNIDPKDLLGILQSESGIDPQKIGDNGATGLFQFIPKYFPTSEIYKMTRAQQVAYADKNIFEKSGMPKGANAGQLYAAMFLPEAARKIGYGNGVLTRKGEGTGYYEGNYQLDVNGDGAIDMYEMAIRASKFRQQAGFGASPSLQVSPGMASSQGFVLPISTLSGSGYGARKDPHGSGAIEQHGGVDYPTPVGTPVRSAKGGTVLRAEVAGNYGNLIEVDHGEGIVTRYAHLSQMSVTKGSNIAAGQVIGYSGGAAGAPGSGNSTGAHLHFEIRINGRAVDPGPYLQGAGPQATQVPSTTVAAAAAKTKEIMLKEKGFKRVGNTVYTPKNWQIPVSAKSAAEVPAYRGGKGAKSEIDLYFKIMNQ